MFLVVAVIGWAVLLGLSSRRFGPAQEVLLLLGIGAAVAIQYVVFGPS